MIGRFFTVVTVFLCLATPASGAIYKCVDASGKTLFSQAPCSVESKQVTVRSDPPPSSSRGASSEILNYQNDSASSPPDESELLDRAIERTRKNIDALEKEVQDYASPATRSALPNTAAARAAIDERIGDARARLSREKVHLEQLEARKRYGAAYPERQKRMGEWNERCNNVALQNTKDRAVHDACKAERKALFGH